MSAQGTVLVTGAGGYLGGLIARRLAERLGTDVRCAVRQEPAAVALAREGFEVVVGDLRDPSVLSRSVAGVEAVVHCAGVLGSARWLEAESVNVDAARALARRAVAGGVSRMVSLSSIEAYGRFGGRVLDETEEFRPNGDVYSTSKALGERAVAREFAGHEGRVLAQLRLGAVYGPHSAYWTQRYLHKARTGRIRVIGRRGIIFPVHEEDVCELVLRWLTVSGPRSTTYNVVHDEGVTWSSWAWAHHRAVGEGTPRHVSTAAEGIRRFCNDPRSYRRIRRKIEVETRRGRIPHERARRHLGWEPRTFHSGMLSVVQQAVGVDDAP